MSKWIRYYRERINHDTQNDNYEIINVYKDCKYPEFYEMFHLITVEKHNTETEKALLFYPISVVITPVMLK